MNAAAAAIHQEIERCGAISFRRFMEVALYHPEHGYYTRRRAAAEPDPFGMHGDFYTAQQLQPVFGILIREAVRELFERMGQPAAFTVVELGAGRGEMAPWFNEWRHVPVDAASGALPDGFTGVVFANELFDALPVELVVRRGEAFHQMLVAADGEGFRWMEGGLVSSAVAEHLASYGAPGEEGERIEVCLDAIRVLDDVAARMRCGCLLAIDYGYTAREMVRFPAGTLMSYRRHLAHDDVLAEAGERDITAHVNFTALERHAASTGWRRERFESMAQLLLRAGERDQFSAALGIGEGDEAKRRLQLKTLLYGMGETFRVLLLVKE